MKELDRKIGEIGEWLGTGTLNFFGRQFAGKDTHAKVLGKKFGTTVLGGGDILRNSVIPDRVREVMDRGELIPSDDYREMVLPYLAQDSFVGKPMLLSAVGRLSGEEGGVLAATEAAGHPMVAVPYLEISEEESFRRLAISGGRGRADDTPEGLRERLDQFNEHTVPVLMTYVDMGLLVRVDAMPEEPVVFRSLVNLLHERAINS